MAESYFNQSLQNFIKDFNYSGAIAHLTDKGYTFPMIRERIGGHISEEYIKEQMIRFYKDRDILLTTEPGKGSREKVSMIRETSPYGKVSYRQVREIIPEEGLPYSLKEYHVHIHGKLSAFLRKMPGCYLSMTISNKELSTWSAFLEPEQVDYLQPFLMVGEKFYLRSEDRFIDIINSLYHHGCYRGYAWYPEARQKWRIEPEIG